MSEPSPGIYPGVTFSDYCAIDAMNCSTLVWGIDSMFHLKAAMDGRLQREDTDALAFGRALHCRLLEPDEFDKRYIVSGACWATLKSGARRGGTCGCEGRSMKDGQWYCGTHEDDQCGLPPGFEVVSKSDRLAIESAAASIANHPAEHLRRHPGKFEVVVIGELMGVRFKARLDKLIESPLTIVDVKKVAAPKSPGSAAGGEREFERRIASYHYGMQAAIYSDLISQHFGGKQPRWFWIVVEDGPPYATGVYEAADTLIKAGRNEYTSLLSQFKAARESNAWPGFSRDVVKLYGPDWWVKENGQ